MDRRAPLPLALGLAAVVFAVDLAVPLGYAVGVLYVVAVAATVRSRLPAEPLRMAVVCSVLLALDVWLGTHGAELQVTLPNRAFSLLAVWLTAGVVYRYLTTERVRDAERARGQALFEAALEAAPDGMLVVDRQGTIRYANGAAARMFGWTPDKLTGRDVDSLVPEAKSENHRLLRERYAKSPRSRPMAEGGVTGRRRDGTELPVEIALSPLNAGNGDQLVVAAIRDVTDRRKLEERIRATQRMEAIGRLAGGVAHDFNNLLAVIVSYGKFAQEQLPPQSPIGSDVGEILGAANRAAALTQQLLAFSRKQVIEPRRVDVNELVAELDRMLGRILGEDIEVSTLPARDLWAVEVDPGQLEQVLMNLAINARDAMSQGGKLTIETSNVSLDDAYARAHPEVEAGDYVLLVVSDTGAGMTEEVRVRVFEPFFTTKPTGVGTGLGLATVYGIVKQARGHVWVYSEPGKGTSFKVYLPRTTGAAEPLPGRSVPPKARGGTETLLVVEDEPAVRRVVVRTLRHAGYTVLEAGNGAEALLKLGSYADPIELLVTDVVMPQMGGAELAKRVLEKRPDTRVLYLSGYTENAIVHRGTLDPGLVFLQKPFGPEDLLRKVRELLDAE